MKTHGYTQTPTYRSWSMMLNRCRNPKYMYFSNYGGRGIQVCERWLIFENFLADMGERPSLKHSIERENNNGNYEPGNCCWADRIQQGNNRRNNRVLTFRNKTQTLTLWSRELGIKYDTLLDRLSRGLSTDQVLKPVNRKHL